MKSDGKKLLLNFRKYSIYLYNSIIFLNGNSPPARAYLYVGQMCSGSTGCSSSVVVVVVGDGGSTKCRIVRPKGCCGT